MRRNRHESLFVRARIRPNSVLALPSRGTADKSGRKPRRPREHGTGAQPNSRRDGDAHPRRSGRLHAGRPLSKPCSWLRRRRDRTRRPRGQQGAFFGQQVVTAGKLRLNRAVASHDVREAQLAYQAQRHRVLNDVRTGYYDVLAAQESVALNVQLVDISRQGQRAAEQLLAAKEVGRPDVIQARVETESARLQLDNAQNRATRPGGNCRACRISRVATASLAGSLDERLPELNWETARGRLLSESPSCPRRDRRSNGPAARWPVNVRDVIRMSISRRACSTTMRLKTRLPACRSACRCRCSTETRETSPRRKPN